MAAGIRGTVVTMVLLLWAASVTECEDMAIKELQCVLDTTECPFKFVRDVEIKDVPWLQVNSSRTQCTPRTSSCCQRAFTLYGALLRQELTAAIRDKLKAECQFYDCKYKRKDDSVKCKTLGCRYPGCYPAVTTPPPGTYKATGTPFPSHPTTRFSMTTAPQPTSGTIPVAQNRPGSDSSSSVAGAVVGSLVAILFVIGIAVAGIFWWRRKGRAKSKADEKDTSQSASCASRLCYPVSQLPQVFTLQKGRLATPFRRADDAASKGTSPANRQNQHEYSYIENVTSPRTDILPSDQVFVYVELDDAYTDRNFTPTAPPLGGEYEVAAATDISATNSNAPDRHQSPNDASKLYTPLDHLNRGDDHDSKVEYTPLGVASAEGSASKPMSFTTENEYLELVPDYSLQKPV